MTTNVAGEKERDRERLRVLTEHITGLRRLSHHTSFSDQDSSDLQKLEQELVGLGKKYGVETQTPEVIGFQGTEATMTVPHNAYHFEKEVLAAMGLEALNDKTYGHCGMHALGDLRH